MIKFQERSTRAWIEVFLAAFSQIVFDINMQPNMLQSTQELSQQVDTLTETCRFQQITHYLEDIV
jgi:hypothetical protein